MTTDTQGGLDRLAEAAATIDQLSRQAHAQRTLLGQKQAEADAALSNIQVCVCALARLSSWVGVLLLRAVVTQPPAPHTSQTSMEVAADRRREVEQLRAQLADSEAALKGQRGEHGACACLVQLAGVCGHASP